MIDPDWLKSAQHVGVTAGASAPGAGPGGHYNLAVHGGVSVRDLDGRRKHYLLYPKVCVFHGVSGVISRRRLCARRRDFGVARRQQASKTSIILFNPYPALISAMVLEAIDIPASMAGDRPSCSFQWVHAIRKPDCCRDDCRHPRGVPSFQAQIADRARTAAHQLYAAVNFRGLRRNAIAVH